MPAAHLGRRVSVSSGMQVWLQHLFAASTISSTGWRDLWRVSPSGEEGGAPGAGAGAGPVMDGSTSGEGCRAGTRSPHMVDARPASRIPRKGHAGEERRAYRHEGRGLGVSSQ